MRKNKSNRRKFSLLLFLISIISLSGALLTFISEKGEVDFGFEDLDFISATASDTELNKNEITRIIKKGLKDSLNNIAINKEDMEKLSVMLIDSAMAKGLAVKADSLALVESLEGKTVVVSSETGGAAFGDSNALNCNSSKQLNGGALLVVSSEVAGQEVKASNNQQPAASQIEGAVFVYHTHSTESYEPYSDGNYHITGDLGTVRNVAAELCNALNKKGITAYHDKTLHDSPTYTNSYGRSLETAKKYLNEHPDIKVVIDLHRDAMSSSGKKYSTIDVNGKKASSFNIVIGKKNENYPQLMNFASRFLSKANELYPGIGGRIIERDYKFNQYLSDYYLLLEVGNNGNRIEEVELTGVLIADVLEAIMSEI